MPSPRKLFSFSVFTSLNSAVMRVIVQVQHHSDALLVRAFSNRRSREDRCGGNASTRLVSNRTQQDVLFAGARTAGRDRSWCRPTGISKSCQVGILWRSVQGDQTFYQTNRDNNSFRELPIRSGYRIVYSAARNYSDVSESNASFRMRPGDGPRPFTRAHDGL